ncbi:unnamed protein product [Adineta steineri]|uniref:Uncharacterized protein n=1 Tax=Adineta steineri TaxID=433720 RepID=A0A814F1W5_9BILA|nr:unnamed protein product [Adineta steineri]CAF1258393.1 unnamed protein product [Adineta steineri]CAF1400022.1 unnamed protein product [Adineta steineri]
MNVTVSTDITPLITKENNPIRSVTKPIVFYAIWNTTAGNDRSLSLPGQNTGTYWPGEPPQTALDGNLNTEYSDHEIQHSKVNRSFSCSFVWLHSKNSPPRDPNTIPIECSNNKESDLVFGTSWTKIYDGDAGLAKNPGRRAYGGTQTISNNSLSFTSYRILITSKRGKHNCVSYSEFEMIGRFPD